MRVGVDEPGHDRSTAGIDDTRLGDRGHRLVQAGLRSHIDDGAFVRRQGRILDDLQISHRLASAGNVAPKRRQASYPANDQVGFRHSGASA